MTPEAIITEMQKERSSQDVATYGWLPHPEDIEALGEACAQRDLRQLAAGLDEQEGVSVSVDEPDWEALSAACGEEIAGQSQIRQAFEEAYRAVVDEHDDRE